MKSAAGLLAFVVVVVVVLVVLAVVIVSKLVASNPGFVSYCGVDVEKTAEDMGQRAETREEAGQTPPQRLPSSGETGPVWTDVPWVRAMAVYVGGPAPRNPNPRPVLRNTGGKSQLRALAQNCLGCHSPQEPPRTQRLE